MKTAKRALSLLLSLMLVLGTVAGGGVSAAAAEPVNTHHIMDEGTDITIDYYDDGTVYISGYGVLPTYTFYDDTSIKKIIFAEDCAVSKIETYAFTCLNSISALTDVEINSTVPLSIANYAFFYEGGTVNYTIKAPEIKSLSKGFIISYGANINVVFDTDAPLLLNYGAFSNMYIGDDSVFTVPYGSAVVEKIKYKFNDSHLQEEYSMISENGDEDQFWQEHGTGLAEGQDYIKYYSADFNDRRLQDEYDMFLQDGNDYFFWQQHSDLVEGQDYVFITEEPEPVILTQENKSIIFGYNSYELIIKNSSGYEVEVISDVTLNIGDGTINSGDITEYTEGTETGLPTDITLEGYTFGGWYDNSDCEGTPVTAIPADATGPQEFWAKWVPNTYTVTWVDENEEPIETDENVPYGETPEYNGETPSKTDTTGKYTYTFAGWTPEIKTVTGDATYKATFTSTVNEYVITFVNDDGTELQSSPVAWGEIPIYTGETPTKEQSDQYVYTFAGWSPEITSVTTNAIYTATFTQAPRKYEIKFVNEDGTELQSGDVAYGETPVYTGETPTKEQSDQYVYTFGGWSPEITGVTGEATYTATFTQAPRKYEIKFLNEDGTELQKSDVAWGETPKYTGETPTKTATAEYTYEFKGWSPEISQVSGEATYTATYTETPVDYKLTWKVDGESYKNETIPFGGNITLPDVEAKEGYTFKWVDEIPATMPAQDVTINGKFTVIEYTATFVDENGETVEKVKFTVEDKSITEPAVPEKAGYAGEWEEYTLGTSDITIKPVYANITSIQIEDYEENSETGNKEDKTFTVKAEDLPEGAEIHWFVNGEDVGTGESYTVEDPTDDYNIYAEVIDKDGNTLDTTKVQSVKVRNGFFDRLKAFFAELIEKILGKAIADLLTSIC
ncbi:MAG: InlB B-repeat-containing protein [Clostridia bacterium]|nr:InlB B-repeat-containing protein [Clostridia bacterium]